MKSAEPGIEWRPLLRRSFGSGFWLFALFAVAMGAACYAIRGPEVFADALGQDRDLLLNVMPRVIAAQFAAGFLWVLLSHRRMSDFLNRHRGNRGLLLALLAGIVTPGGPASAFPFLAMLAAAGAERGILVCYITSWALLGMQRLIVWDIPFMGLEFSVLRFVVSLPLPLLAGLIASRLRISIAPDKNSVR